MYLMHAFYHRYNFRQLDFTKSANALAGLKQGGSRAKKRVLRRAFLEWHALILEKFLQLSCGKHLADDVAAADEFAFYI